MRRKLICLAALGAAAACAFAAYCSDIGKTAAPVTSVPETTTSYLFILRDFEGKIALYENDENVPSEIYEIYTDSLPDADAKRLRAGIAARSDAELLRLLEDYLS